jgi:two-component system sensor kinase FixL
LNAWVGRRKDGSEFPAEITLSPLAARLGSGAVVSVVNVSERNRTAAEFTTQRNEIAHLSRVTMLGELSGSLAHELNQPLTAILSNAQAAQRHMSSDNVDMQQIREILADIVEQDKRAGEVIVHLRALLQKGETRHAIIDVAQVAADVLRLMRSDLINHGVEARLEAANPVPEVLGDRVQIQQVLMNLLINACDAMAHLPREDRRILVLVAAEQGEVQVCVRDNGSGIAPGVRDRLFEPFFTTKAAGTGLGLSICRTIMEAHSGRICGSDNTGGGATFCIAIPVAPDGGTCDGRSDRVCCR